MVGVKIDREGCISCGQCWTTCPEFFEQNEGDQLSQVKEAYRKGSLGEGEAPDNLGECVKTAAEGCPVQVIHVQE